MDNFEVKKSYDFSSEENNPKSPAFGIDLGTTNSCISVVDNAGIPHIIPLGEDKDVTLPSCVMWDGETDTFIVGKEAYEKRNQSNVCYSVKRLMGTDKLVRFVDKDKVITRTPAEVSSLILKELVNKISNTYKEVKDVVITVPAEFNNKQIEDTKKAGELAGLNVLNIMREPTAASLAYKVDHNSGNILVYDLGGGTFDVSIVSVKNEECTEIDTDLFDILGIEDTKSKAIIQVKGTRGDTHLGGDDLDLEVLNIIKGRLEDRGVNIDKEHSYLKQDLILRIEKYKKMFCSDLKSITKIDLNVKVRRETKPPFKEKTEEIFIPLYSEDFQKATVTIFNKTVKFLDDLLSQSKLRIDVVELVGGSTKNEYLRLLLRERYKDSRIETHLNPDEAVALGAAIQAKRLKFGSDDLDVFDVTASAFGIEVEDGRVIPLIEKNQSIPFSFSKDFITTYDDQEIMSIRIYEGQKIYAKQNTYLGDIVIRDLPKKPAGEVSCKVILSIDSNGLLVCKVVQDGKEYSKPLINVLGAKVVENNPTYLVMYDKWERFANSLENKEQRDKLNQLIVDAKTKPDCVKNVIDYIRAIKNNV